MARRANPLDRKLLRLQSPSYPWVMQFHLTLADPIDRQTLADALVNLSNARPDVACRLEPEDLTWRPGVPIGLVGDSSLDAALDLDHTAIRVLWHSPESIEFHINHAFGDGVGCIALFEDLLRVIRGEPLPDRIALSEDDFAELRTVRVRARAAVWLKLLRLHATRTTQWPGGEHTHTTVRTVAMDALRSRRGESSTSNDAYVAAMHRAIATVLDARLPTRVSVPVDLRPFVGERTGLGNGVINATTILPRSDRPLHLDADEIALQLRPQRERDHLGALLSAYLRVVPEGPPRAEDVRRRIRWPDSGVTSNVGVIDVEGLDVLWASPPAQNIIGAALSINDETATIAVRARGPAELIEAVADHLVSELG